MIFIYLLSFIFIPSNNNIRATFQLPNNSLRILIDRVLPRNMKDIRMQDRLPRANPAVNNYIRRQVRAKNIARRRGQPLREQVLRRRVREHVPRRDGPVEALLELERRRRPRVLGGQRELAIRPREQPHREVEEVQRVLDLGHRVDEFGVNGSDKGLHVGGSEVRL